jgi:membrane fusion protein (multidrug efflux system)
MLSTTPWLQKISPKWRGLPQRQRMSTILGIAIVVTIILQNLFGSGSHPPALPPTLVETITVMPQTLSITLRAVGSLRANESVIIRPEVAGIVDNIHFEEGAMVKKDAPLITLDQRVTSADLAQAEANLILAQANYRRTNTLIRSEAVSERLRDEALAKLKSAEATVDLAKARLDKTALHAPFAGMVGLRRVSPGEYVKAGQDIVSLATLDPIKVDFAIPEIDAGRITTGQKVTINVDAVPERNFSGTITALDPLVDVKDRSVPVRALVPNPDGLLRPGYFARVQITVSEKPEAFFVPETAIIPQGNKFLVLVLTEQGLLEHKSVTLGLRRIGEVEILSGITSGNMVVISGQNRLRPGQKAQSIGDKTLQKS